MISLPGVIPSPKLIEKASLQSADYKPLVVTSEDLENILKTHGEVSLQLTDQSDDMKRLKKLASLEDLNNEAILETNDEDYGVRLKQIIAQIKGPDQLPYLPFYVDYSITKSEKIYFKPILHQGTHFILIRSHIYTCK
jgi:hypothetical protein